MYVWLVWCPLAKGQRLLVKVPLPEHLLSGCLTYPSPSLTHRQFTGGSSFFVLLSGAPSKYFKFDTDSSKVAALPVGSLAGGVGGPQCMDVCLGQCQFLISWSRLLPGAGALAMCWLMCPLMPLHCRPCVCTCRLWCLLWRGPRWPHRYRFRALNLLGPLGLLNRPRF